MKKYVLIIFFILGGEESVPLGVGTLHDTEAECEAAEMPRVLRANDKQFLSHCYTVEEAMEKYEDGIKWQ